MYKSTGYGFLYSALVFFALCLAPSFASAAQINVSIGASTFTPANVTVAVGDTVTWTNSSSMPHTVTARSGAFNSGTIQPGGTFSRTFTSAGTFTYDCQFHPGMTGTVTVVALPTPVQQTQTQTQPTIPPNTNSSSMALLQAQIQALLAEVSQLQAELAGSGTVHTTHTPAVVATPGPSSNCPLIGRVLRRGSSGDDVSRLQRFLASDSSIYPEGEVTGYFGALTEAAVKRWQTKFNIVSSGDPDSTGFGVVGPRTAAAISLQCSTGASGGIGGTGTTGGIGNPEPAGPQVGGFIQVTPVSGQAPHTVSVIATVNTVLSCQAATYTLDWGDGTIPSSIAVPTGNCGQLQQTYSHVYVNAGTFVVRLSAGGHNTTATVQVAGPVQ